jgi:hypothetical protein
MYGTHVQSYEFHALLCSDSYCNIFMEIIGQGLKDLRFTPVEGRKFTLKHDLGPT